MGFSGWSPEAVEFFQDLGADNTKAFWSAHKDFYEASVREPMEGLLDELSGEFGPGRIARPYRDIRFRAGKSPYKTEIYAALERGGYVRFSTDGLTAALGYCMVDVAFPVCLSWLGDSGIGPAIPSGITGQSLLRTPVAIRAVRSTRRA